MSFQKEFIAIFVFIILSCIINTSVDARSVYAIPKHDGGKALNVYDVLEGAKEGQLEYRAEYHLPENIHPGDVTLDSQTNILFVTSELNWRIQLVNARTFLSEGEVIAEGAYDLAGVLIHQVDADTTVLYTVDRGTNKLFMYDWDAGAKELTPLPYSGSQSWYTLQPYDAQDDPVFACGLALDDVDGTLYASQLKRHDASTFTYSNIVYAYDPNISAPDPNDRFGCIRKIDLGQYEGKDNYAVDIDIDSVNGWLYAGGFNIPGGTYESHNNLIRYDLIDEPGSAGDDGHVQPICAGVIGLAVSQQSHNVYMTTFNYKLEAWDTDRWVQIDAEHTGFYRGGGGVCVSEEGYVPPFEVVKIDDVVGCASPRGEEIEYTISIDYRWAEAGFTDPNIIDSIKVVDYLPREVDFDSAQPDDGFYDDPNRSYTWTLTDSNSFGDTLSFELVVQSQNEGLTPGGVIENNVEVIATINEGKHVSRFTLQTPVCDCTGYTEVIYVDETAAPSGNGQTWGTAFKYLQDALAVALPCDEIWVADGTYKPTTDPCDTDATFPMVNGVGIYGGFEGGEEERSDRNWADPAKETILSGDIVGGGNVDYIVVSDSNNVVGALDGFTITGGSVAGVYCEEGSPVIQHNKIMASGVGIYCKNAEQPVIKNNWIYRNDYGIYFDNPGDIAMVRNNTVVYNDEVGIAFEPGTTTVNGCLTFETGTKPMITNCILWGNGDESIETQLNWEYLEGLLVHYSCIQDSNDVTPQPPYYTINTDPCFVNPNQVDPVDDDYRLKAESLCIDAGNPNGGYGGERDIDKHFRVLDGKGDGEKIVDMGADEYCNEGSENDADFNNDKIVDTNDLRELAAAWLIDYSDPCWATNYDKYDLNTDNVINYGDFAYFAKEWLWMTCDKMQGYEMMEMMMGGGMAGGESMLISKPAAEQQVSEAQPQAEPSVEEQIEQIKEILDWLDEIKDETDEEAWLKLVTILEEMLKDLEDSQKE